MLGISGVSNKVTLNSRYCWECTQTGLKSGSGMITICPAYLQLVAWEAQVGWRLHCGHPGAARVAMLGLGLPLGGVGVVA